QVHAFGYGRTEVMPRRVDIYAGTDASGKGALIRRIDAENSSQFGGKWSPIILDEPLTLTPGTYGIAYHSRFEFTQWVAGNSPNGAGYVWVSAFDETPFVKADETDFGFTPNLAIRLFGKFTADRNGAARSRVAAEPADDIRLIYRNGDESASFAPHPDDDAEQMPLHINWRDVHHDDVDQ
ncbi:MAG: hypothetical protein V3T70_07745, partial [Phycisphaerae bacterium]